MTAPRFCPKCSEPLPVETAGPVRCPRCDHHVLPANFPDLDLGPGGPVVRVTDLPPPPPPLKPVLLSSETAAPQQPLPIPDGREWIRCPKCKARLRREDDHCFLCGERLGRLPDDVEDAEPPLPPRRDCEPHRGALIGTLARVSVIAGGLSFAGLVILPFAVISVLAAAAGIGAVVMARDDLELMDRQVMDPAGREATLAGQGKAITGIVLGIAGALLSLLVKMPTLLA